MADHTPATRTVKECFLDGAGGEFIGEDFDNWLADVRATAVKDWLNLFAK